MAKGDGLADLMIKSNFLIVFYTELIKLNENFCFNMFFNVLFVSVWNQTRFEHSIFHR